MGEKPDLASSKPIQSDDAIELNGYMTMINLFMKIQISIGADFILKSSA
jgi:hypothetical protein